MIASYNRSQIFKGVFLFLAGFACYGVAWLFFGFGLSLVAHGFRLSPSFIAPTTIVALALITWSGYRQWKNGAGFKSYVESSLFHDLGNDSASAVMTDHYARQVTGPAYVISQVLLGGPLFLLRAMKHFQQRLPDTPDLEQNLQHVLQTLQSANKWQAITEYPDMRQEILMLAQMKRIDFSAHKGIPRVKASPDGV